MPAARIFACPVDVTAEGQGIGAIYDLKTGDRVCVLLDTEGKPLSLGGDLAAWSDITAQLDPKGEFVAVREVGRNDESFGIWNAKTGQPLFVDGMFRDPDRDGEIKQAELEEKQIPGVGGVYGVAWTWDGRLVVAVNSEGEVFVKSHLLADDAHKLTGATLSDVLEHTKVHGHWSPVKFPARFLSEERLLAGNYVVDTKTWTVLLELPKNAEIAADNSVVATWTDAGELELCDMNFWRAYHEHSAEPLRLREQLLLWQVSESDKERK